MTRRRASAGGFFVRGRRIDTRRTAP